MIGFHLFNFIFPEQRVQLSGKELRNIEEQFEPRWIKEMERRMSFARGKEPVWWELFAEQFDPAWLQRLDVKKEFRSLLIPDMIYQEECTN